MTQIIAFRDVTAKFYDMGLSHSSKTLARIIWFAIGADFGGISGF